MERHTKRMNAEIPNDLFNRIKAQAALEGITLRKWILIALMNHLALCEGTENDD